MVLCVFFLYFCSSLNLEGDLEAMEKNKILYVTQEINPFLIQSEISNLVRTLAQGVYETDKEIRIFMPRFGVINERRHQLHEVIRLSGMNLIVNDYDHPLIIKVASIPQIRIQVYFIDNEEYFKRKLVFNDENGKFFNDNDERSMFFCKGVLETVKKLGWVPEIIHCHGWMNAFVPLYIKKVFNEDPIFSKSKVIFSIYNTGFEDELNKNFGNKAILDGVDLEDVAELSKPSATEVYKYAAKWSDGVIIGSEGINTELDQEIRKMGKPILEFQNEESYVEEYNNFYDSVLSDSESE